MRGFKKFIVAIFAFALVMGSGVSAFATTAGDYFSVTFINGSEILGMLVYEPNERLDAEPMPVATKADDEDYTYTFDKWVDEDGNEVVNVTKNMSVFATYTATEIIVEVEKPAEDKPESIKEKDDKKDDKKDNKKDDKKDDKKSDSGSDNSGESAAVETKEPETEATSEDAGAVAASTEKAAEDAASTEKDTATEKDAATENNISTEVDGASDAENKIPVDIEDEKVPEAAQEDNCVLHWIIILLSAGVVVFTITRIVVLEKKKEVNYEDAR